MATLATTHVTASHYNSKYVVIVTEVEAVYVGISNRVRFYPSTAFSHHFGCCMEISPLFLSREAMERKTFFRLKMSGVTRSRGDLLPLSERERGLGCCSMRPMCLFKSRVHVVVSRRVLLDHSIDLLMQNNCTRI